MLQGMKFTALVYTLFAAVGAYAETKVLENFTLIDGTGRNPVANAALVIVDGRIRYAGPKTGMTAPSGPVERVDLAGKFVMPGIINLHGLLGAVKGLVQDPKNYTRENLGRQLATYASYGVTAVASMGSDSDLVFQVRSEQRASRNSQTRIFTAWRGFTGVAGYPTNAMGMKGVPFEVTTPAEVQKAIAQLADRRVDLVKIWVDDHLGREKKISIDLCRAIIDGAHKHGLKVGAHIFYLDDAKALVDAGLDGLAHSVRDKPIDDALIASMKKKGAWQQAATLAREVSTFAYAKRAPFLDDAFFTRGVEKEVLDTLSSEAYQKRAASDPDLAKYPGFLATAKKNLKKLADSGVRYGFGTDSGPPARFSGYFEHMEMEQMVDAGLTPMQVITSATRSSAEYLGASKDIGTLEAGRWADLIVLSANPLTSIRNTRGIEAVYISGNKVK
jgi:imidazolonepropionase-like amidohydrolase